MKKQIYDALSQLLLKKLDRHKNVKLDSSTCVSIYTDIFQCIVEVFQNSQIQITNESMNLLAQMYYDSININGNEELDPNIFDKKANLNEISTKELAMLATLFNGTPFASIFIYEVKRRS